ncbi:hypothetical protein ACIGO9_20655 [Nocardia asteroides]
MNLFASAEVLGRGSGSLKPSGRAQAYAEVLYQLLAAVAELSIGGR